MDDQKLIHAVNRSGFPLQIKTAGLVDQSTADHGWRVLYSEHAWRNENDDGFIDLVLENGYGTSVLVVECKRVLNTAWVFLVPSPTLPSRRYCKSWVSRFYGGKFHYFDWHEMAADPSTPQSGYCVVDGEDPKSKPMLERVAAEVIAATEAIANEEQSILIAKKDFLRTYFGAIVTTATLTVCSFDADSISISDGKIGNANFTDVPYLRFHKQLSTNSPRNDDAAYGISDFGGLTRARENTVFIINAKYLPQFLSEFHWDGSSIGYLG